MTIERITVGQVEVLSISDCQMAVDACDFFSQKTVESFEPFAEFVDEECAVRGGINVASFLLLSQGRRILVDAGLGPGPVQEAGGASGDLVGEMQRRGIDTAGIDTVVITHLHFDHIGWLATNSGGEVRPTFAKAKYIIPRADWDLLYHPDKVNLAGAQDQFSQRALDIFNQSRNLGNLLRKLSNIELVNGEVQLTDEVTIVPTPGHTPGHQSLAIASEGQRGFILGDVAHLPMQVQVPQWTANADVDPELGKKTRLATLKRLQKDGTVVAAGHFPAPGFGRIVCGKARRYWQPVTP